LHNATVFILLQQTDSRYDHSDRRSKYSSGELPGIILILLQLRGIFNRWLRGFGDIIIGVNKSEGQTAQKPARASLPSWEQIQAIQKDFSLLSYALHRRR
jgi:hypothetical protein